MRSLLMKITVNTTPFSDQKPGTSGLRKKVKVYQQPNYIENFAQSIIDAMQFRDKTIVISGDGRFLMDEAIQKILKIAAANGVSEAVVGKGGLMSSPAVSLIVRKYNMAGGIYLSSSHNPGGPNHDFGIKIETPEGPSQDNVNKLVFERSKTLQSYFTIDDKKLIDLSKFGKQKLEDMTITVVDSVAEYTDEMQRLFDFDLLKRMLTSGKFKMRFDGMNAAGGPYAKHIFEEILGAPKGTVVNATPLPDFGGLHPDPNPTYAKHLVDFMAGKEAADFACATDGDVDRYMVLGRDFFLSPSDCFAIMVANSYMIPGYSQGLKGAARSMPTSCAVDRVCQAMGIDCYETPTGWKFFSNLLSSGKITLCGEESSGAGSSHMREKDGIWVILYILNLLAVKDTDLKDMAEFHWKKFGRNYYSRHDFEEVETAAGDAVMAHLLKQTKALIGKSFAGSKISKADEFTYVDPVDKSVTEHQGMRFFFEDGSRIVYRLSGTGTKGATIRVYIEKYSADYRMPMEQALKDLVKASYDIADLKKLTGRDKPTVIA